VAVVVPFRAWRYNTQRVGSLDKVIAPPYDVIGPALHLELHRKSPLNIVRVDLGRATEEDTEDDNRYTRAAALLEEWKRDGTLVRDERPGITVVEEHFIGPDGEAKSRRGFLALMRLEDFSRGVVFPHEFTLSGPKEDRYQLMHTTRMSLSPIFLLYSLEDRAVMRTWDEVSSDRPPAAVVTGPQGAALRLWPADEPDLLAVLGRLEHEPILIADGHHRYETALRYREARHAEGAGEGPWDYVLAYLVNTYDPGLAIYATDRMVHDLPASKIKALPDLLTDQFFIQPLDPDPERVAETIDAFLSVHRDEGGAFGFYSPAAGRPYGLLLKTPDVLKGAAPDRSEAARRLDVTILHSLIFETLLEIDSEQIKAGNFVTFVKTRSEAYEGLAEGRFQAGFFMNPTKLEQMREVATGGERLPQKSTYFFPKLPTGLVFFDLDGDL
jgi:uncharacterized protein (DUF1015 family)